MPAMSALERAFCRSAPWTLATARVILPWALQGLRPDGELLELGGGSGGMAAVTASRFPEARITVTDVDRVMVAAASRRLRGRANVCVEQEDVTDLPYDDGSFDYVASYLMLHHVVDWHQALAEVGRVLRPGGRFVGYDLAKTRLARWVHRVDRSPHELITADELAQALTQVGLGTVTVQQGWGGHVMRFVAVKR